MKIDVESRRNVFGTTGASKFGALLNPIAQSNAERNGPIGKLVSQLHRTSMMRAIGYTILRSSITTHG